MKTIYVNMVEKATQIFMRPFVRLLLQIPFMLLLMIHCANAQIVYHDINPDLSDTTLTQVVLGQSFNWDMVSNSPGAIAKYGTTATDSLIMTGPSQGNALYLLDAGDTIQSASTWLVNSQTAPSSVIVSSNRYLGFRVGTSGNYRYGWFRIGVNSSSYNWTIKSYGYQQTLNKLILAGDTGNDSAISVTGISVQGMGGVSSVEANGGTLQMIATITPANATNQEVTWSVQNGSGTATINSNGMLIAQNAGTVTVRATAEDGSNVSGTKTIMIHNPTGITDINKLASACYPNPVKDRLILEFEKEESIQHIAITNLVGQVVYSKSNINRGKLINLTVGFLPEGIYILTYRNAAGKGGLQKFVKAK